MNTVQLSGPTYFAPVINNIVSIAKDKQDGKHYYVLLILTDGMITDIQRTKQAIVKASALPISIVIVGIGDANFKKMHKLDSDHVRLNVKGREAERDIVSLFNSINSLHKVTWINMSNHRQIWQKKCSPKYPNN